MAIATAEVEIIADTKNFERDLRAKLSKSGVSAGKTFNDSFNKQVQKGQGATRIDRNLARSYGAAGTKAGQQFARAFSKTAGKVNVKHNFSASLTKSLSKDGNKAGKSWGSTFAKGAVTPIAALGKTVQTIMESVMDVGGGAGKSGMFGGIAIAAGAAASAVAPLIGYLGMIPAAVGGSAAAVATLATAFNGVGEALKAGFSGDMAKFQESLDKLAPSAQSVVKDIVGLKPAFDGLQKSAQGAFFDQLLGQFQGLQQVVSGRIQAGMTKLAAALGQAGAAVVNFAKSGEGSGGIQRIFEGMATSIQKLTPALQPLLQGFTDLAARAAGGLGNLGPQLAALGKAMSGFANGGGLDKMLGGAAQAASQLGKALAALWPGLKAFGGVINTFGASVRAALIPAFAAVSAAVLQVAPAFQILAATIGGILQQAIPPLAAALAGLGQITAALVLPPIMALAPALQQFMIILGPQLTQAIAALVPQLVILAGIIGGALAGAIRLVAPAVQILGPIFQATFGAIIATVQGAVGGLQAMVAVFTGIWHGQWSVLIDGVKGLITSFGQWINGYFWGIPGTLFQAGKAIIEGFGSGMASAWGGVASWIAGIAEWLKKNKGPISYDRQLLVPAGVAIMQGLNRGLQLGFADVRSTIHGVNTAVAGIGSAHSLGLGAPVRPQPMAAGPSPFTPAGGNQGRYVDQSRRTTVGPPTINVQAPSADPARVARRAANQLAMMATA